ncbi:Phosphoribosylanthranilate isomerase [Chitinispirillum alkaliphilum]|nr:Phosphoribosylanthranilate isomerase [Chitinispirillum alkaliphilum]
MPVRIKICGITRYEDARIAANLGVDALGFIFYPGSPRFIEPSSVSEITKMLPPFISKVGVFVDEELSVVEQIARESGIDTVQLHGSESPRYCDSVSLPVVKAFSVQPNSDLELLSQYNVQGFLLDTWRDGQRGGTGVTFDWSIAVKACARYKNVILAGGLGPSNIQEALDSVSPYAVDVNSGAEISPGVKNPLKLRDVVKIVKAWKGV